MRPRVRQAALAIHVVCSVGWIGAAAAYLPIGIVAAASHDPASTAAAWSTMSLIGWSVVVPLGVTSWATGLLMALATSWGLVRHYWVLIAFVLTTAALAVLLVHMPTVTDAANRGGPTGRPESEVVHAVGGILVLVAVAVLNIYKPRGLTRLPRTVG